MDIENQLHLLGLLLNYTHCLLPNHFEAVFASFKGFFVLFSAEKADPCGQQNILWKNNHSDTSFQYASNSTLSSIQLNHGMYRVSV